MIGGERAGDKELKEKRLRKKKAAEKRLEALASALSKVKDEDGVMLKVYDDIQEELKAKTETLRKYKQKVRTGGLSPRLRITRSDISDPRDGEGDLGPAERVRERKDGLSGGDKEEREAVTPVPTDR